MRAPDNTSTASLVVVFAAGADPGVAEALASRPRVRIVASASSAPAGLAAAARGADVLVVRSNQRVGEDVFAAGAGRLRAVVQASAGLDNIDHHAARDHGVRVVAVDPGNATAVAELTLLSLVALFRGAREHWARTASGEWTDRETLGDGELRGKTLGLIGLGRVGGRVALRARAFEMEVLAVDPYIPRARFDAHGVRRAGGLRELLPRSAALSIHCPLTDETRGMIGEAELDLLPRGAVVVNTARGAILDEQALARALDSGRVSGAALDVYPVEPPPPGGLRAHPRVLPTAHIGGHTRESHEARARNTIEALGALVDELLEGRGR